MRAFTLGYGPAYEKAIRMVGNGKAPGGYCFRTRDDAIQHSLTHDDAERFSPYEIEIPGDDYDAVTTDDFMAGARARHAWHTTGDEAYPPTAYMKGCAVCEQPEWMTAPGCSARARRATGL